MIVWVQFAICLILIGFAGTRLAHYADAIAEKTGMGGSWVGVVLAGIWLPFIGAELAVQMQWNESFVGTLFVAFVTSLPELVVTIAAVRIQALDMAVGNVLGSNLFNTVIIAVDDLFYLPGPLLADVEQSHIVSALVAIAMTGVVVVSLYYRTHRMRHVISWSGLTLIALYILNAYTQYQ